MGERWRLERERERERKRWRLEREKEMGDWRERERKRWRLERERERDGETCENSHSLLIYKCNSFSLIYIYRKNEHLGASRVNQCATCGNISGRDHAAALNVFILNVIQYIARKSNSE